MPFDVSENQVIKFLGTITGLSEDDCAFRYRRDGKFSGLAFIRLVSEEDQQIALTYHKKYIGDRYVEVFKSSRTEFKSAVHTGKSVSDQETVVYT